MATYTATDNLDNMVETNPTGSEDASKLDDALRETRAVLKAVMGVAHTSTGRQKAAVWRDKPTGASTGYPQSGSANAWNDHTGWTKIYDPDGLDQSTNPVQFKPTAGTYLIYAWCPGYNVDKHQIRVADVTAGNVGVTNLYGSIAFGNSTGNTAANSRSEQASILLGTFTTDGTKVFKIQHMVQATNTTDGYGRGISGLTGSWTTTEQVYGGILLLQLG